VYISSLQIDRFGTRTNLVLDSLREGLNVFYGPTGSGKTTVVRFIRGMLYGLDDALDTTHVSAAIHGVSGAMVVQQAGVRQTIRRVRDAGTPERVIVETGDGTANEQDAWRRLAGEVPQSVFDTVFSPGPASDTAIGRLVQQALSHGGELLDQPATVRRLSELKDQLRTRQRELAELKPVDQSLDQLVRQRSSLQREIEALQAAGQDRRASVDRRLRKLDGELADLEEQLEELQQELHLLDAQIESRQTELARQNNAFHTARLERERARGQRSDALREVDAQLERWGRVLQDVESRGRQLREMTGLAPIPESSSDGDPRDDLQRLEQRLDDLQTALGDVERTGHLDTCQCRTWRTACAGSLREMRDDVYRLCNSLSRWQTETNRSRQSSELGQLGRCEAELRAAIAGLTHRRHRLLQEISQAGDVAGDVLAPIAPELCACNHHPTESQDLQACETVSATEQETLTLLSDEIDQLTARRHEVQRDLANVEDEARDLQQRRAPLELEYGPRDGEHRLESLRLERQRIDDLLSICNRRRELSQAVESLESEIRKLEASLQQPSVLREAAELLRRLTDGQLQTLTLTPEQALSIQHRDGRRLSVAQLPPAAQTQTQLSLCLALASACRRQGTRLPLILDDVLGSLDSLSLTLAAGVLRQAARNGQQILVFTRQQAVAEALRGLDVDVRALPGREPPAAPPKTHSEDHWHEVNRQLSALADQLERAPEIVEHAPWSAEEFPGELTDRVRPQTADTTAEATELDDGRDPSEYFLLETSPIQDAPSIDAATAERFRKIDVLLVRDLLQLDVHQAADRLRYAGITARMIRRWQAEALLTCHVPHLRPYDARILVGCGITDPDQLAQMDAAELSRRVEQFAVTSTGQVLLRAGNRYELSRLTDWISAARKRQGRSAQRRAAGQPNREHHRRGDHTADDRRPWERTARRQVAKERAADPAASRQTVPERTGSRPVVLKMEQDRESLRFYLNTSDPLVDAPSIGPRTAERFATLGITTVDQFLKSDPQALAARLRRRRVTAGHIRAWQQQTTLACRIPWLRGHDAQILVACGIQDAESLAAMDPAQLWTIVQPFLASAQCKRILRNGKAPDFEEVYSWIQWARNARLLHAA
jgi:predicted flap endonuclease-1-like 5' DNA nuclease